MNSTTFSLKELKEKLENGELDLSLSTLTEDDLPLKGMKQLKKFQALDLSCNVMTSLPEELCSFTALTRLDVSKNLLAHLPENIGDLVNLQSLDLLGNKLTTLPERFGDLKSLWWLDVRDNPLSAAILKEAGDCLDDKECKTCALRVVKLMDYVHVGREKIRIEERAKQEAEAERLADEARAEKKKQKQMEKERRRLEFLSERKNVSDSSQPTPTSSAAGDVGEKLMQKSPSSTDTPSGPGLLSTMLHGLLMLLVVVTMAAGAMTFAAHYCESSTDAPSVCKSVLPAGKYIEGTMKSLVDVIQGKLSGLMGAAKR